MGNRTSVGKDLSMNLGPTELIVVLAIVLLLFGAKKLPDLARSLGQAQREFRDGGREGENRTEDTKQA